MNIFENLTSSDFIVLGILLLIIVTITIILTFLIVKRPKKEIKVKQKKKKSVLDKIDNTLEDSEEEINNEIEVEEAPIKEEKKPEVNMALATENIPSIEEEKKPEVNMALATENIPSIDEEDVVEKEEDNNQEENNLDEEINVYENEIEEEEINNELGEDLEEVYDVNEEEINTNEDIEEPKEEDISNNEEKDSNDDVVIETKLNDKGKNRISIPTSPIALSNPVYEEKKDSKKEVESNEKLMEEQRRQDERNKTSIEEVLKKMQADIEKKKYETIDKYEEDQEENAIISYEELLKKKMVNKEEAKEDIFGFGDSSKTEAKKEYDFFDLDEVEEEPKEEVIIKEVKEEDKPKYTYSATEFISPIYGREENSVSSFDYSSPVIEDENEDIQIIEEEPEVKETVENVKVTTYEAEDFNADDAEDFLNRLKSFRSSL